MLLSVSRFVFLGFAWLSFVASAQSPHSCEEHLLINPVNANPGLSPDGQLKAKLSRDGSMVVIVKAADGSFVTEFPTGRPAKQVNWTSRAGGELLVTFVKEFSSAVFNQVPGDDAVTAGIDVYDARTLKKVRTAVLSKGWKDYKMVNEPIRTFALGYQILVAPRGDYVAKIYPERFKLYEFDSSFRLSLAREMAYKEGPNNIFLRMFYASLYFPGERMQRDISEIVAASKKRE